MAEKRQKNAEKNREKIMKTTLQLLLKKGSTGAASTTEICAAANLTRPTLYHHFGSKRGLLLAVHIRLIERDLGPLIEKAESIADPLQRLSFMIRAFTEHICMHPELRVLIHDTLIMKDKHFVSVRDVWKKHYILLKDTINELKAAKRIDGDIKPSWAALFFLGMQTWITYWFDFSKNDSSVEQIKEAALRLVLNGLGCKEAPPKREEPL